MYIKLLFNYIFGYVHIRIEGYFVEKLINKCINKKIFFWNIKRDKATIVYTNVGIRDFKELIKIAKETNCKVKILNKKGIPFLIHRYKKRKIFAIIFVLILVLLLGLSNFIWNVDVEGNSKIGKEEIVKLVEEEGITIGTLKSNINTQNIVNNVRLKRDDIAWIGISIEGTNAKIKIVETETKPEVVNEEDYCNIVAEKDAQIVKVSAHNGIPVVKEGDIVTKGQILIAGWIEGKYTGTRYVHANGKVQAKIWYTQKEKIDLKQLVDKETGNTENKYGIKINNFQINLYKTLSKFEKYDTIEASNKIKIFSNFYLPIELIKKTNKEKTQEEVIYTEEEAKNLGIAEASKKIEEQIENKDNILQKYVNAYANEEYVEVEVTYEVLENIGTKEKIVF